MSESEHSTLTKFEIKPQNGNEYDQQQQTTPSNATKQPPKKVNKAEQEENKRYKAYIKLQVILWSVFGLGIFSSLIFLIASMTDEWVILIPPTPYHVTMTKKYMLEWRRGLWRDCMLEYDNSTDPEHTAWQCIGRDFFPSVESIAANDESDNYILDYERSIAAFAILTLVISSLPMFFTWYSIKEPRYIFKRLAGGLYFITAGCAIVCIEVFKHFIEYGRKYLPNSLMRLADYQRGFSYYLACISVGLYILVGLVIFFVSGKKKGRYARSMKEAVENEPVIIGRI